jgi:hypothetical protein
MVKISSKKILLVICAFLIFSSGCSLIKTNQTAPTPTLVPTPLPTPTVLPARAILIAPNGADPTLLNEAQTILTELTSSSGLLFEIRTEIATKEITPDVKILVFLIHPENLGTLSNAAPKTQFAVISDLNWNPGSNVTIIRRRPEYISFMAGFISVNMDNNFRGGALLSTSDTLSQDAFANGGHFFCGLCSPSIPPYVKYPLIATQAEGSSPAAWQAAFDQMNVNGIRALYVAPEAYSPELFSYLVGKEIILYGSQPPLETARPRWAATLLVDGLSPLREIWPDLLAGKGGKIVYGGVRFADVQPAFITAGKLEYFQKLVGRMRAGLLNPLTVPAQ